MSKIKKQIFQKSVIKKYLKGLNNDWINSAYDKFKYIFNPEKIERIKNFKEEEYQDGFLRDLFIEVLGYTLKTDSKDFNLVREFKNQTNSKKVDAAILKDDKVLAVIELKSTKTKDLKSITDQAFNYKNNQQGCKYVITSNFQKLRFYIEYTDEYEEFDLFNLQKSDFELLYLILRKKSIFEDIPQKLKTETRFHEEKISTELYKDYSNLKRNIFENLIKNNLKTNKLILFKKTQKLLDRLIFIFFAEDCQLLPANSISQIIDRYEVLKKEDAYKPLYDIYKQYFGYMNIGKKGESYTDNIPAYNGGLFAPDKLLDSFKIDDKILKKPCLKISAYDFSTEVDVNILGQIFERSINEIEEMEEVLNLTKVQNSKLSKRKKDGVFYTPKYITQYIINKTIGRLCTEKRKEMDIYEIEFDNIYKTLPKIKTLSKLNKKGKILYNKLNDYKKWLKTLKILDPACGSGAFLNQALIFLIGEHKEIDSFISDLTGDKIGLFDTDKSILENNLFGVDINEESVEIAKLSLWLRTAQRGRKLSHLNNNIKCGNSLINDSKIVKNQAFNWSKEFKSIIDNGGFDIIIGNPPYVPVKQQDKQTRDFLKNNYKYSSGSDLYVAFIEKSFTLLKDKKYFSFICPNKFFGANYGKKIRDFIKENLNVYEIWDLKDEKVFKDALISTIVISIKNEKKKENTVFLKKKKEIKKISLFDANNKIQIEQDIDTKKTILKLDKNKKLEDFAEIRTGIMGFDYWKMKDIISNDKTNAVKLYTNGNIRRYNNLWEFYEIDLYKEKYKKPYIKLDDNLLNLNTISLFSKKNKIIVRGVARKVSGIIETGNAGLLVAVHSIIPKNELNQYFILSIINSKLIDWYHKKVFYSMKIPQGSLKYPISFFKKIPIKNIDKKQQKPFIEKTKLIIDLNNQLQKKSEKFIKRIKSNTEIEKLSRKLQMFYNYDFKIFVKELKKKKIELSFKEQDKWEEYFDYYKLEINKLQRKIEENDKEADKMVYKLYNLTKEEIEIIEK